MTTRPDIHCFQVRLHDTDAAGVLFFGHLFRHAHDAYESLMTALGFPLQDLIAGTQGLGPVRLPIAQASADYLAPMRQGETIRVQVSVAEIRRRSFVLDYRFTDTVGGVRARARTLHCLSPSLENPHPLLPEGLATALDGLGTSQERPSD